MKKLLLILLSFVMVFSTFTTVACDMGGSTQNPPSTEDEGNLDDEDEEEPLPTPPSDDEDEEEPLPTPPSIEDDGFEPITRFAVTSDVHVRENGDLESLDRLNKVFDTAYGYSSAHPTYNELDGIFFAGDNTNNGYASEQTLFFNTVKSKTKTGTVSRAVMGNHEFYATATDEGSYSEQSMAQAPIEFLRYSGYESVDAHLEIDGYHYIFLSMDEYGEYTARPNEYLSESKLNWLRNELDIALADDTSGEQPIFVFQHVPPKDTMLGSIYYDTYLREVLNDYPNVVNFAGHTHMPATDPRSIWQGEFTALQTGSMAYLDINISGHSKYDQAGVYQYDDDFNHTETFSNALTRNANMYYIVEINADNEVKITVFDAINNEVYDTYLIDSFGNPSGFDYTGNRVVNEKPMFTSNRTPTIISNDYRETVFSFDQATCTQKVQHYRIEFYSNGSLVKTEYKISGYFLGSSMPQSLKVTTRSLTPSTTYDIKIYPVSVWAISGTPLTLSVTTTAQINATPVLTTKFNSDGSATNSTTGTALRKSGSPTVSGDYNLSKNVATFNGNSAYAFNMSDSVYSAISASLTLECYFMATAKPTSGYQDIFSNQQAGGFGFEYNAEGKVEFIMNIHGSYRNVSVAITPGVWTHLIGTYDGLYLKLYKDGNLVASLQAGGTLTLPSSNSRFICIGGDSGDGVMNNFFNGKIAVANLYSSVLTQEQVKTAYNSL